MHPGADELPTRWAALLAHWTNFARAAVALPKDADGQRWRDSVQPIITMQAVTMAMGELDALAQRAGPAEYSVGVDRAAILIRESAAALNTAWRSEVMPPGIIELMEDARAALEAARSAGTEVLATSQTPAPDPADLAAGLKSLGFTGELFAVTRAVPVQPDHPIAFVHVIGGRPLEPAQLGAVVRWAADASVRRTPVMRQVYRRVGAGGEATYIVAAMTDTLPPGQPMLQAVPLTI